VILATAAEWVLRAAEQAPADGQSVQDMLFMVVDYGIRAAGAIGIPTVLAWFFVDRRRTRAQGAVEERSITANVAKNDASAFEAHVLAVEKAVTMERASFDRQIARLQAEVLDAEERHARRVQELVADSVAKDMLAADLGAKVATLTRELHELRALARANDGEGVA
jgi:hypothetical protein